MRMETTSGAAHWDGIEIMRILCERADPDRMRIAAMNLCIKILRRILRAIKRTCKFLNPTRV